MRVDIFTCAISLRKVQVPSPILVINLPWTYKSFTVKENHLGPAASEILIYIQTHKYIERPPLTFIKGRGVRSKLEFTGTSCIKN